MTRRIFVRGIPAPKGSKRGFVVKGRANIVDVNPTALRDWRAAVQFALQGSWEGPVLEGPVKVGLQFHLLKPRSVPKKRRWPTVKPDLDKLARAVLDAMTGIVYRDDAQVCELQIRKDYHDEGGVEIEIDELEARHD